MNDGVDRARRRRSGGKAARVGPQDFARSTDSWDSGSPCPERRYLGDARRVSNRQAVARKAIGVPSHEGDRPDGGSRRAAKPEGQRDEGE